MLIVEGLSKKTIASTDESWLFKDVNLTVSAGEMVAIMGKSGVGKTTLLNSLCGLLPINDGKCTVDGVQLTNVGKRRVRQNLRESVSLVFQSPHLVPGLTLLQNVQLAWSISGKRSPFPPHEVLDRLDIGDERNQLPESVSGGQAQRTAIARSLVTPAKVILADEPTAALDGGNVGKALSELRKACAESGKCVVLVTHDFAIASHCERVLHLEGGKLRESSSSRN
ncbi:ATP-binding cassette domain-containing protein [Corynebacterium glutamicum]|uniref:ABC transporter ATP-binding protein n=1 Tax=Corynebacterium TaxID=1716 RepID=UPI0007202DF4|nr:MULTISPECIES: ATP-binding cassette domain-containing protein [Corynebacterium]ALP50072.1 hypothetical protein AC079_07610 [Corynebacterium glutamicum]ANR62459.1 sigma 54 interacting domain-containing protein [[Brevibacterium] flavum ZL-1]ANR65459.1 sigma 54 interacting domain-containing protein [Corynebacterium glutamicum ZL-6]ANU33589.1 hypothetical protein BBD29_07400 [Corynebacterium glutamicum]APT07337.1 hypothetical protein BSP99_07625 [Corynebacterium glutamicum]